MLQVLFVLLGPLGGADEAFLFGVPGADDDAAAGFPALLEELADAVDGFEHGGGAGGGIGGAVDPGVTVVAGDDPGVLLGRVGAVDGADDVPDDAESGILLDAHVDGDGGGGVSGAEVVGEGKRALPVAGGVGAGEGAKDGGCVFIGERIYGDGGLLGLKLVERDALGVGEIEGGGDAGGLGVAGVDGQELDGAALDGGVGAVWAAVG